MNVIEKLRSLVTEIREQKKPMQLMDQWVLAGRLLDRLPVDQAAVKAACRDRDIDALDAIVTRLESPAVVSSAAPATSSVSEAEKAAALRAFRKRLKLARLSDESRIGNRPTTSGRSSEIDAIQPPNEFGRQVWQALVADGRLVDTGQGFYALAEDRSDRG